MSGKHSGQVRAGAAAWDDEDMRITRVESTDLFTGSTGRALQVMRVTVEATEASEEGVTALLRIEGAGAGTPEPFGITLPEPGESRTGEVSVALTGSPGVSLPVTVIAETPVVPEGTAGRVTRGA